MTYLICLVDLIVYPYGKNYVRWCNGDDVKDEAQQSVATIAE